MTEIARTASNSSSDRSNVLTRVLRSQLFARLSKLQGGRLEIRDSSGSYVFGIPVVAQSDLSVRIDVLDTTMYRAVAAAGSVGAAEAYMEGCWRCSDLVALVRLLVRNRDLLDSMEGGIARLAGLAMRGMHALKRNSRAGSRRNIAAHYDLGNEFFQLFLSSDLMYSAAMWDGDDDALDAASTRKLDVICRKLELRPGDRVVEIGTGWGGFALHAAGHYGCHVTTTTISREQHDLASQRIRSAGLEARVTLLLQDYRDLEGRYDKLVSIEMIEAIGAPYLATYFECLGRLLRPGGLALLQAITIEDHRYEQALQSVDFIKRHVFPGSFIPSISAMLAAKTRSSDLALVALEDFGLSYARTLREWRERFMSQLTAVRSQGFDESFIRMWEYYLAYCEGGFLERSIGVAHLLMRKPPTIEAVALTPGSAA